MPGCQWTSMPSPGTDLVAQKKRLVIAHKKGEGLGDVSALEMGLLPQHDPGSTDHAPGFLAVLLRLQSVAVAFMHGTEGGDEVILLRAFAVLVIRSLNNGCIIGFVEGSMKSRDLSAGFLYIGTVRSAASERRAEHGDEYQRTEQADMRTGQGHSSYLTSFRSLFVLARWG